MTSVPSGTQRSIVSTTSVVISTETSTSTTSASISSSSSPSSTSISTTATSVIHSLQFFWNFLLCFTKNNDQVMCLMRVVSCEKCHCSSFSAGSSRPSDTMDIILNISWHIVVDNCGNVLHIYIINWC